MRLDRFASSLLATLLVVSSTAAWAEPSPSDPAANNSSSSSTSANSKKSSSSSSTFSLSDLPKKALGFLTGCVVGIPVCCVRNTIYDEKYAVKNWTGDTDVTRLKILTGVVWAPFAASEACGVSPLLAMKHSAQHFNEPFSKAQFGLGDLDEYKLDNNKP